MLISEFIKNYKVNEVVNPDVEQLIDKCLSELKTFYGYEGDNYEPNNWGLDVLTDEENELTKDPDELILNIDNLTLQMSNEAMFYVSSTEFHRDKQKNKKVYEKIKDDTVYRYKQRTIITDIDHNILHESYLTIPLLLSMKELITIYNLSSPDINVVVRATRLMSCYKQMNLLINLSKLWVSETTKHIDRDLINTKQQEFDKRPLNVIRKREVSDLVEDVYKNDKFLSIEEIRVKIVNELHDTLTEFYGIGVITNDQKKPDEDITIISKTVLIRWISDSLNKLNNETTNQ